MSEKQTAKCECGEMTAEQCAAMPSRHCGLWEKSMEPGADEDPEDGPQREAPQGPFFPDLPDGHDDNSNVVSTDSSADPGMAFVIKRLKSRPITYSVVISHFVSGGEWMTGVSVHDAPNLDEEQKMRVAADLRFVAGLLETASWSESNNEH